jgi:hypothetical protein
MAICKEEKPALMEIEQSHNVACFLYGDITRDHQVEKGGPIL